MTDPLMVDSARQIENLLHTYAERIDAGDLEGVAELFRHGRIHGQEGGPPGTVFEGYDGVRALYENAVRLHGPTPLTRHVMTNAIIEVDEEAGTATSRSSYTVLQATPDLPLQVIVVGRYADSFHLLLDGVWWFDTRTMYVDLAGDLTRHLTL